LNSQEIRVYWPWKGLRRYYELDPLRITYRDAFLLAYDKEAGIPTQQTPSDAYNNLYAALQRYLEKEGSPDPYVALHHRLDRETSGIILFGVDREVNRRLGNAFQRHQVVKDYLAWVDGTPAEEEWTSSEEIGRKDGRYCTFPKGHGKKAETAFRVLHREADRTLVWARPKTGRTHQIRLHLAAGGLPVLGDRLYGKRDAERLFLHAFRMTLPHPVNRSRLTLTAPVPQEWRLPPSIMAGDDMSL
jgi:23S rRNA pseudouridine1911/1915/1917 synthase